MCEIVITGIGVVSAMGVGREAFWRSCLAAESGIKPIAGRLEGVFRSPLAGLVTDYDPRQYLKPAVYRRMSRVSRMAVSACVEAVRDSGLDPIQGDTSRMAIVAGTAHGSSTSIDEFYISLLKEGPRGAQPFYFPETVPNAPAGNIAMVLGITGPNTTFGQNDISAENALVFARRLLVEGRVDLAVVCGLDEINPMFFGCLDALKALNPGQSDTGKGLLPKPGAGIILGEGAGALVLERHQSALARKAPVYAALTTGCAAGGMAGIGRYDKLDEALLRVIARALDEAGYSPEQVDQISVSANYSGGPEQAEARALQQAWGPAYTSLQVTPLRYLTGSFGGAGILSAAALALSLSHGKPLPVLPLEALSQGRPLQPWQTSRTLEPRKGLMTACTYGGGCAALVMTRPGRQPVVA